MTPNDMIDILNGLMATSLDGECGYTHAAEHASSMAMRDIFTARAADCSSAVSELKVLIGQCGGQVDSIDKIRRSVCHSLAVPDNTFDRCTDLALLEACERREGAAEFHYRQVLDKMLPEPIRSFVEHQYLGVQRNHEQMRCLRDRFRAALAM